MQALAQQLVLLKLILVILPKTQYKKPKGNPLNAMLLQKM